jgi:hypothetical protein
MARKKRSKPKGETRTSFTFPSLHQDVSNAVSNKIHSTWFSKKGSDEDSNNKYSTHVMGKFRCDNDGCSNRGWNSKKVAILIKGYPKNGYKTVVFNQRCESCNGLGTLTLDENSIVLTLLSLFRSGAGVLEQFIANHYFLDPNPLRIGKDSQPFNVAASERLFFNSQLQATNTRSSCSILTSQLQL